MGYIDVINHFWDEFRKEPLPSSAVALFFYLANECNREHWHMPVRCFSVVICQSLTISKATLTRSRDLLKERGFINFSKGRRNFEAPKYLIVGVHINGEHSHTTSEETICETTCATIDKTTNKIKKEEYKDIEKSHKSAYSLVDLESRMRKDSAWLKSISCNLKEQGIASPQNDKLNDMIEQFFKFLSKQGYNKRNEEDCRNHFINWLKKKLKTDKILEYDKQNDRRRGTEVSATSPKDYEGAF